MRFYLKKINEKKEEKIEYLGKRFESNFGLDTSAIDFSRNFLEIEVGGIEGAGDGRGGRRDGRFGLSLLHRDCLLGSLIGYLKFGTSIDGSNS